MTILSFVCLWLATALAWSSTSNSIIARVAFLSDLHVSTSTNETYTRYMDNLDIAIKAVNAAKPDLVLIAGDLTEDGTAAQYAVFKERAKEFKAPVLVVAGNHDVGHAGNDARKRTVTPQRLEAFESVGPNWFATNVAGIRVVGLNASLLGTGFSEEAEQWKFLEREVPTKSTQPTLLLLHNPLFINSADEPDDYWNIPLAPRKRLLDLAGKAGVRAVLSGHLHRPIKNETNGILFLSNPALSFGLPPILQPVGWTLLTLPATGEIQSEFQRLR